LLESRETEHDCSFSSIITDKTPGCTLNRFWPHSARHIGTGKSRLRFAIAAWTLLSWYPPLFQAQTGCKPQDPAGYFEGSTTSQQAGKVDVSLNLRCDSGRYRGDLVTPVGTYSVKDGHFEAGKLQLTLGAGSDTVTIDGAFEGSALRGNFVSSDDKGPLEFHRSGDAKTSSSPKTLNLTNAQWHEDLAFLARELPKRHANAFHSISREKFDAEVSELDHRLDQLNSDQIYVGMDRIVNLVGDGHTYIRFPEDYSNLLIDIASEMTIASLQRRTEMREPSAHELSRSKTHLWPTRMKCSLPSRPPMRPASCAMHAQMGF